MGETTQQALAFQAMGQERPSVDGNSFLNQSEADLCTIIKQEKHILLVLSELCQQLITPSGLPSTFDKSAGASKADTEQIDLLSVAHRLQESGMSVKQTQRCWE